MNHYLKLLRCNYSVITNFATAILLLYSVIIKEQFNSRSRLTPALMIVSSVQQESTRHQAPGAEWLSVVEVVDRHEWDAATNASCCRSASSCLLRPGWASAGVAARRLSRGEVAELRAPQAASSFPTWFNIMTWRSLATLAAGSQTRRQPPTLEICSSSGEEGVSCCYFCLFSTLCIRSSDPAIYLKGFLPNTTLFSSFFFFFPDASGAKLWFIRCDALLLTTSACSEETRLWQSLISRGPSRGCNSLQTQTHIIFLTMTEMKSGQTQMIFFLPLSSSWRNEAFPQKDCFLPWDKWFVLNLSDLPP